MILDFMDDLLQVINTNAVEGLSMLETGSVHCCVTSPPYWGLRDYSTNGQLGLEKTPEEYVSKMVEIFREVRRVLRKDGTLWLNLGDSYAGGAGGRGDSGRQFHTNGDGGPSSAKHDGGRISRSVETLKPKDLCGIPWRVAFALQADGWWLRQDIIWSKPNPMPESVTDRCTKSHEYLFLFTKAKSYFYDAEAIKERCEVDDIRGPRTFGDGGASRAMHRDNGRLYTPDGNGRNKRSVWTVATAPYPEAHFATYPPDLIKPCIMAGTSAKGCCSKCGAPWERISYQPESESRSVNSRTPPGQNRQGGFSIERIDNYEPTKTLGWQPTCKCGLEEKDWDIKQYGNLRVPFKKDLTPRWISDAPIPCTVVDPFAGSGTTGSVALELGRKAILIELNPKYCELIRNRCNITPGLQLA